MEEFLTQEQLFMQLYFKGTEEQLQFINYCMRFQKCPFW